MSTPKDDALKDYRQKILSENQMRDLLGEMCKEFGGAEIGRRAGIKRQAISRMLSGQLGISQKVAAVMGFRRRTVFERFDDV